MTPCNVCTKLIPQKKDDRVEEKYVLLAQHGATRGQIPLLNFHYQAMFDRWLFPTYEMLCKNKENTCFLNSDDDFRWQTPSNCLTQSYVSCGIIVGGKKNPWKLQKYFGEGCQVSLRGDKLWACTILFFQVLTNKGYNSLFSLPFVLTDQGCSKQQQCFSRCLDFISASLSPHRAI